MREITLVENEVLENVKNTVRTLTDGVIKSKAYYNALAANSVMSYLRQEGLLNGEIVNMHSSVGLLADLEIADIQLPNLHIDVRAVFDENLIFIPKKHFEYKILPDIYLIVKFDEDLQNGTLLGFVSPEKINKKNQNEEYYFVGLSALTPVEKLKELILSSPIKSQFIISEDAEASIEKLIMLYMDHDIDSIKLEKLLEFLKNSVLVREKLVEFENFERLSYMALKEFKDLDIENNDFSKYIRSLVNIDEFSAFEDRDEFDEVFSASEKTKGLFVDDEISMVSSVQDVVETDVEELPLEKAVLDSDIALTSDDELVSQGEVFQESDFIENESLDQDIVEESFMKTVDDEVGSVVETVTPVDEFEVFETTDEFDMVDETALEESEPDEAIEVSEESVKEVVQDVVEDIAQDESLEAVGEDFTEEASLLVDEKVVAEGVENDEQMSVIPVDTALSSEDLELQVAGLENIGEELQLEDVTLDEAVGAVELELEQADTETEDEVDILESGELDIPAELNVVDELQLDDVSLDSDTVIGLTEGVMDVEVPQVIPESSEDLVLDVGDELELSFESETVEQLEENIDSLDSVDVIDNAEELDFTDDISENNVDIQAEGESVLSDVVSVTDEDVDLAIEQSLSEVDSSEVSEGEFVSPENDDFSGVSIVDEPEQVEDLLEAPSQEGIEVDDNVAAFGDEQAEQQDVVDAESLSLEELLAMENDLLASQAKNNGFKMDEDEDSRKSASSSYIPKRTELTDDDLAFMQNIDEDELADLTDNSDYDVVAESGEMSEDASGDFAYAFDTKQQNGKNAILPIAALVTVIGLAGAGAWYFLGGKASNDVNVSESNQNNDMSLDVNDVVPSVTDNVDKTKKVSDNVASKDTIGDVQVPAQLPSDSPDAPEQLTIQKIKKDFSQPNTYLSVSKIVWDVPEYLTYNDDFGSYLQTLGSTLKLNLSSDLLLINENTVFDKVKVKIQLKDSGRKYSASIVDGCGTQVVDDLVLQSVKNTLNLLKPPVNSLDTADEDLYITIYL